MLESDDSKWLNYQRRVAVRWLRRAIQSDDPVIFEVVSLESFLAPVQNGFGEAGRTTTGLERCLGELPAADLQSKLHNGVAKGAID